jgi:hypothetical protein
VVVFGAQELAALGVGELDVAAAIFSGCYADGAAITPLGLAQH